MGAIPAFAQVDTAWVRRYNGPADSGDCAYDVAVDNNGHVYVTGYSHSSATNDDYVTIKYYPNGDTAWVRTYDKGSDDWAQALAVGKDGNVYVAGYSFDVPSQEFFWITVGYDEHGDTTWTQEYPTPLGHQACDVAVDDSGYIYAAGEIYDSLVTIKYRSNGDTVWVRKWPDADGPSYYADFLAVDLSGSVYVIGSSSDSLRGQGGLIIKYKSNGDTAWARIDTTCGWYALAVDDSGYVYVSGGCDMADGYCTRKYKSNGDTVWTRTTDDDAVAYDLAVDKFYNVFVTGRSYNVNGYRDYATVKYYPNGDVAWVRRYNGSANHQDKAYAIAVDTSGNAYVTGYSIGIGTDYDYATIGYSPNGETLWVRRYNGPGNGSDWANSIAVDDSNNVYVTGGSYGSGTDYDYATIKYVPVYSISGNVRDGSGSPLEDSVVFLAGDRTGEDTTDSNGDFKFAGLPVGDYIVFRDSLIDMYDIHLTSDTSGFNFTGYTDVKDSVGQQEKSLTFALSTNYPNPFNPQTIIKYTLNSSSEVTLKIYNIKGQLIKTLIDMHQKKGFHQIIWDGTNEKGEKTSSGIYFCQLKAGDYVITKKMVKLR